MSEDIENTAGQNAGDMTAEELSEYYERQARRYGGAADGRE